MGAWGLGLFQSDHDLDLVSDFSGEAGLHELEEKAQHEASKTKSAKAKKEPDFDISYSIYADLCSDPEFVRKHLDSGALDKLFNNNKGYAYVLIGACAMTLGCKLRTTVRQRLKNKYNSVGLMPDAEDQMHAALMGDKAYKSGEAYHFSSPGLMETMMTKKDGQPNSSGFIGMNVPSPGGFFAPPKRTTPAKAKTQASEDESMFRDYRCAGCGAVYGEGGAELLRCGKCKGRKYCGKECQKQHWVLHKKVCTSVAGDADQVRWASSATERCVDVPHGLALNLVSDGDEASFVYSFTLCTERCLHLL